MKTKLFLLLIALLFTSSYGTAQTVEKGNASYYSAKLKGRKTANGEYYHADSLTCAHKTHPFGTLLRVYNPKTDKEVTVRVTDRGPFRKNFIVDLSYSAAKQIGILRAGYMPVEVTVVGKVDPAPYKVKTDHKKRTSTKKHSTKKKSSKKKKSTTKKKSAAKKKNSTHKK